MDNSDPKITSRYNENMYFYAIVVCFKGFVGPYAPQETCLY